VFQPARRRQRLPAPRAAVIDVFSVLQFGAIERLLIVTLCLAALPSASAASPSGCGGRAGGVVKACAGGCQFDFR